MHDITKHHVRFNADDLVELLRTHAQSLGMTPPLDNENININIYRGGGVNVTAVELTWDVDYEPGGACDPGKTAEDAEG